MPRKRIVRTVTLDEGLDRLVRRVWNEAINHGWRRPTYSQALGNLMTSLFYVMLHHMAVHHKNEVPYKPDRETALKVREILFGDRPISEADYELFDMWVKALGRDGLMDTRRR